MFEVAPKKRRRKLWESSCTRANTPVGVFVGDVDGKICVWRGAACADLLGHEGSISALRADRERPLLVSAGYDSTVRVWALAPAEAAGADAMEAEEWEAAAAAGAAEEEQDDEEKNSERS